MYKDMGDSHAVSGGGDGDGWSGTKPRISREETACFLLPIEEGSGCIHWKKKKEKECWYLKQVEVWVMG